MRYIINIVFLLGFALNISGQNLVLNGGFEDLISCPQTQGGAPISYCYNWYSPSKNTPDYFNICASGWVEVPNNMCGYQNPRTGNGYGGFASSPFPQGGCEYLSGKLSATLTAGKRYCLYFYINLADLQAHVFDRIGVYFSSDSIHYETYFVLPVNPQVETTEWTYYTDTINWMPVNLEYSAQGGEKYFTIGNYRDETQSHYWSLDSNQTFSYSYYYLDDVSLYECKGSAVEESPTSKAINVYPNPASSSFTIQHNLNSNGVFELYSIDGKKLDAVALQGQEGTYQYQNNNLKPGVYLYRISNPNGIITTGKLAIIK